MSILKDEFNFKSNVSSLKEQPKIVQAMFNQIVKLQAESMAIKETFASYLSNTNEIERQNIYDKIDQLSQELFSELMDFYREK
jgi:predicted  nucleic acid-binding Zn-ribbon protein